MSGRILAIGVLLLLSSLVFAQPKMLVVLQPRAASPLTADENVFHPEWVLWPTANSGGTFGGLLSITTGLPWTGDRADLSFISSGTRTWVFRNFKSLVDRGYFDARSRWIGRARTVLIADPSGGTRAAAAFLALSRAGPTVRAEAGVADFGPDDLLVYGARSWDDEAVAVHRFKAKALVIEYPPERNAYATRFWTEGPGWPPKAIPLDATLGASGVVRATHLLNLLFGTQPVEWSSATESNPRTVSDWLYRFSGKSQNLPLLCISALIGFSALAFWRVKDERSSLFLGPLLVAFLALPAIDVLGSQIGVHVGAAGTPWINLGLFAIVLLTNAVVSLFTTLPTFATFLCSAIVMALCNPVWSSVFQISHADSQWSPAIGMLTFYLVAATAEAKSNSFARYLSWSATLAIFAAACFGRVIILSGSTVSATIPLICVLAAEQISSPLWFVLLGFFSFADGVPSGFAWKPLGLIRNYRDATAVNLASYVFPLAAPFAITLACIVFIAYVADNGFGFNRVVRAFHKLPVSATSKAALSLLALGLAEPRFWASACVVAGSSLVLALVVALRELG